MMRGVRGLASPMVTALPRMSPMVTRPRMMSSGPREEADIVIAGGGMVGCSAAVALANLGEKYQPFFLSEAVFLYRIFRVRLHEE